jgi:copper oxidase (laccase) domain-containing protein
MKHYSIPPSDLTAVIGPHNAVCCYEVGEDVVEAIQDATVFVRRSVGTKPHFNQALANQNQLIAAGIPQARIVTSTLCTQCRADLFFSFRREGRHAGRMLSIIGLAP